MRELYSYAEELKINLIENSNWNKIISIFVVTNIYQMKKTYDKLNYDRLYTPTGDPFADVGGYALKEFAKRYSDLDILEIIMKATDIYVDSWKGKINPFFLNSKITQPAFSLERKKEETKKYFEGLLTEETFGELGVCRIAGNKTKLFPAGRDNTVLSGSGTLVNYHHAFQPGIMLSKEVIIRYHFLPLGCELLMGRIAVIHCNNSEITELFATECCNRNLNALGRGVSDGVLKSKSRSPGTALFRFIDGVVEKIKQYSDEISGHYAISLYHFTNFGASPDVEIYTLPFEVFRFYRTIQKNYTVKKQWNTFVAGYYTNSDYKTAKYDETKDAYLYSDKNDLVSISENDFRYWRNRIYEKLINYQSIVSNLLRYARKHELSWELVKIYQLNIRKMKKETLEKIDQMAEFILSSNDEHDIKKVIQKLDNVKNSYLLRRFVLKDVVSKYYNEGNSEAIVTVEDYAEYLFPDTNSWQETRDVLLISLYQKLHERKVHIDAELQDDDNLMDEF